MEKQMNLIKVYTIVVSLGGEGGREREREMCIQNFSTSGELGRCRERGP